MAYFLEKEAKNTIVFFCGEPFVNEICLVAMWDMWNSDGIGNDCVDALVNMYGVCRNVEAG